MASRRIDQPLRILIVLVVVVLAVAAYRNWVWLTWAGLSGLVLVFIFLNRAVNRGIEARERLLAELDHSKQNLQTTLRSIGDGVILTDSGGGVTFLNPVAEKLTGWAESEAAGQPIDSVLKIVNEKTKDAVESPIGQVLRTGQVAGLTSDAMLIDKRGTEIPIDDIGAPILNRHGHVLGAVVVFRDMTQPRGYERQIEESHRDLQNSEEHFRGLAMAFPQLVWFSNADGEIEYANKLWDEYVGPKREGSTQFGTWTDLVHPEDAETYLSRWKESLASGVTFEYQCRLRRASDGSSRWFLCRAVPVRDRRNKIVRWIGACTDIDEQIRHAEELKRANEALQRSNADLEQFAYAASHDLQEPLRMISLYTQLLKEQYAGQLDDRAHSYVDFAVHGAQRMERLLQDLLAFSRVASTPASTERTEATIALATALDNLAVLIQKTGAQIHADELPAVIIPSIHLVQLFQNLIGNALKYSGDRPPEVWIEAKPVRDRWWQFSVRDSGIGIEAQYVKQIFGVFKRLHGAEYEGTGIGLAICQRIVERNGGRIWLESTPGVGSIFFFTLRRG